jgi:hypothetical protein
LAVGGSTANCQLPTASLVSGRRHATWRLLRRNARRSGLRLALLSGVVRQKNGGRGITVWANLVDSFAFIPLPHRIFAYERER